LGLKKGATKKNKHYSYKKKRVCLFNENLNATKEVILKCTLKNPLAVGKPLVDSVSFIIDASKKVFGACAYIRWILQDGSYWTRLIMTKTR